MHDSTTDRPLRAGSLFSGYGGLGLAIKHHFNAETNWFSEISEPVARVFSHHWPEVPKLGDITAIDWTIVPPVDILCGGFPCQDVSTAGKQAGLAPGTRSGLWANMATAIDALQPGWVVIENVRGLLSAPATRPPTQGAIYDEGNSEDATLRDMESGPWGVGGRSTRSLRALGAVFGDLADHGFNAEWIGLPASHIGAPHQRFRIFVLAHRPAPDPARVGLLSRRREPGTGPGTSGHDRTVSSDHRPGLARTAWLTAAGHRVGDTVVPDRGHVRRWGRYAGAIARWEHITGRHAPTPALLKDGKRPRPAPKFVEWLMGLEPGWVTDPAHGLSENQQLTALGNGVVPAQAVTALRALTHSNRGWHS